MPPTMGGPTEAGQGGLCSLPPEVAGFRSGNPRSAEKKTTRDRQEPARPRTPRATLPYLNFPSNIRT